MPNSQRNSAVWLTLVALLTCLVAPALAADDAATQADDQVLGQFKSRGVEIGEVSVADSRGGKPIDMVTLTFDQKSWAASSQIFPSLQNVKQNLSLRFSGVNLTEADLKVLNGWPNVRAVNLSRCTSSPEALRHIASLPNLRELVLSYGTWTNESLVALVGHAKLRQLTLERGGLTDDGLQFVRQFEDLDMLRIRLHQLTSDAVAELQRALPQTDVMVTEPDFDVPDWKLDRSKAFVYVLPKNWSAENRGLPHDVILLPEKDGKRSNIVITDQPGNNTLGELKGRYEQDLAKALKDFQLVSSELLPSADSPAMVRIIHTNTHPGVAVRQVSYILPVGDKRYFVACTVGEEDGDKYDQAFEDFVNSMSQPGDAE